MEDLVDDASPDEMFLMISEQRSEKFADLENLWNVENNRGHDDWDNVVGDAPPVTSSCELYLVSVRGADCAVALSGDGDREEHTGRQGDMAQALTPGEDYRNHRVVRNQSLGREDQIGEDDQEIHHAQEYQEVIEHVPHCPEI